jgi:hypothetical protein
MKVPITPKEALDATNPNLSEDERLASAQQIMAGVAANDGYLNSRSEIEQAITLAEGGQVALPHAEREAEAEKVAQDKSSIESTVVDDAKGLIEEASVIEKKVAESFPGEAKALEARLAELTGGKL